MLNNSRSIYNFHVTCFKLLCSGAATVELEEFVDNNNLRFKFCLFLTFFNLTLLLFEAKLVVAVVVVIFLQVVEVMIVVVAVVAIVLVLFKVLQLGCQLELL